MSTATVPVTRRALLEPAQVEASHPELEVVGVFNPGAATYADQVVLLVRVAERPRERRPGYTGLPRFDPQNSVVIDWVPDDHLEIIDTRVVRRRDDGLLRLTFLSHLRVVHCGDGGSVIRLGAALHPTGHGDAYGLEDPRISQLDGRYLITYVSVSEHGVATALASTVDFVSFDRHGVIFPPENKDVVIFPERIGGEYVALHRPSGASAFTRPEMWLARSPDLVHWGRHEVLELDATGWQSGRVGAGPPPTRTPDGWLAIYHGNRAPSHPGEVGTYAAGALLLDPEDPARVLARTPGPFFAPEADFERDGFVADVVFPTGTVTRGGQLLVYYGAADARTAVAFFELADVLAALA
jgi:predicted GH43/DUF377 family glycosyl hydrolase